jgi:hypothetical protein
MAFGLASLVMGLLSFTRPFADAYDIYRAAAFFIFTALCFVVVAYEARHTITKGRWYVAAQPPALFLMLFLAFAAFYNGPVNIWFPVLMDMFAFTFALLIILYLSSLFTWKTALIFAAFLPILDVILVFSGPMITAAQTFTGLGLPVLVFLPKVPIALNSSGAIQLSGLGLGEFFFSGILVIQTLKRFNQKTAAISALAIAISFGIWEAFLPEITAYFNIAGFPATVCIITGWLPVVAVAWLLNKNKPAPQSEHEPAPSADVSSEPSLPAQ